VVTETELQVAVEWLNQILQSGPQPWEFIHKHARAARISNEMLGKAKRQLGTVRGHSILTGCTWKLPDRTESRESIDIVAECERARNWADKPAWLKRRLIANLSKA
jgi:hypothetical protein